MQSPSCSLCTQQLLTRQLPSQTTGELNLSSCSLCTLQLLTRRAAKVMVSNQRLERWCFDVELIYLAQQLQIPVEEVQVHWTEVPGGSGVDFSSGTPACKLAHASQILSQVVSWRPSHILPMSLSLAMTQYLWAGY